MKTFLAVLCFLIYLSLNFGANGEPTKFAALSNELLYDMIEFLDYDGWLIIYELLGDNGARILGATVSKMVVLPRHTGKPIPQFLASMHAARQRLDSETSLVVSRFREVLREATGVKSISLDDIPVDSELLELMYRHAKSLERLSIKFRTDGCPAALGSGWIRRFTKLVAFEFHKSHQSNVRFPADFEPLTELVYLNFGLFELSLPPNAFQHLGGIRFLRLEGSSIIYFLPEDIFKPLTSLRTLILDHNAVESLASNPFEGLVNLERLILCNAHKFPYRINSGTFLPLKRLTSVKLENSDSSQDIMLAPLNHRLEPLGFILDIERREFTRQIESK